ncbi:MAG TPA: hypothetical protein VFE77_02990 [Rhodanobacter sp.]|nr:hypothetical protein [Rhodanobacter sp.]
MSYDDDEQARLDAEAEAKRRYELERTQEDEDLRAIVRTTAGRAFLWSLFTMCGLYADDFRGEDTHSMARATGKRSIALKVIENLFTADPHAYTLIRDQAMARRIALLHVGAQEKK